MSRKPGDKFGNEPAKSARDKRRTPTGHSRAGAGVTVVMPWSVPLDIDTIAEDGLRREIAADDSIAAAVAVLAEVRTVSNLQAVFDISRAGEVVHVTGQVSGRVGQNCVVTLEPIDTDIDEPIDLLFAPVPESGAPTDEDRRHKADAELPEPLIDGRIDLGAIASEFLILGIDPYPRKAGAEFTPVEAENDAPHPFAALEALKKRPGGNES